MSLKANTAQTSTAIDTRKKIVEKKSAQDIFLQKIICDPLKTRY